MQSAVISNGICHINLYHSPTTLAIYGYKIEKININIKTTNCDCNSSGKCGSQFSKDPAQYKNRTGKECPKTDQRKIGH